MLFSNCCCDCYSSYGKVVVPHPIHIGNNQLNCLNLAPSTLSFSKEKAHSFVHSLSLARASQSEQSVCTNFILLIHSSFLPTISWARTRNAKIHSVSHRYKRFIYRFMLSVCSCLHLCVCLCVNDRENGSERNGNISVDRKSAPDIQSHTHVLHVQLYYQHPPKMLHVSHAEQQSQSVTPQSS